MTEHRSVSQVQQYCRCPYCYYLSRVVKAPQRPAAWLVQGSAFHEAAELWERGKRVAPMSEVLEWYGRAYERETQEYCETHPDLSTWFASGPYRAPEDLARRFEMGRDQLVRYTAWARAQDVATGGRTAWIGPRGYPAVEVPFDMELDGVRVRGYIDKVDVAGPDRHLRAVDYKTGNKTPETSFQLDTYIVALWALYGVVASGSFYMAKPGRETAPVVYTEPPVREVTEEFVRVDKLIRAEEFPPNPSMENCMFCSVASSCEFNAAKGGSFFAR